MIPIEISWFTCYVHRYRRFTKSTIYLSRENVKNDIQQFSYRENSNNNGNENRLRATMRFSRFKCDNNNNNSYRRVT